MDIPKGYHVVETDDLVPGGPEFVTRFRWRAERRRRKLQTGVLFPSYRYEIRESPGNRWAVVAMQNVLEPINGKT
jgi:hypothetical protein